MPNYAVIDLGSNSIRLVVYEVKNDQQKSYTGKDFKSLINDKVMAGLAAYVSDGVFTDAGIERAASVLKGHAKRVRYFNCKKVEVFATAVLRNASNCAEALSRIEEESDLSITLLSEKDEAHLGFVGATCDRAVDYGTLVDIGGGSTELTCIEQGGDTDSTSMGQGSLSSFAQYVHSILPTAAESTLIADSFRARLAQLPHLQAYRSETLYGIGGSVRAAAKMHAQASGTDARPKTITKNDIHTMLTMCHDNPDEFAHTALKAAPERIHTLVPGCVILLALFEELGATHLEICKHGVRDGYLIERMLMQ